MKNPPSNLGLLALEISTASFRLTTNKRNGGQEVNKILKLNDGRNLEWLDNGVASDEALVFHHGTTIAFDVWNEWLETAAQNGVRAVAINRPGVGASTRNPGRRMLDDVADAREVIVSAGIRKFVSIGWSGGGGRALGSTQIADCAAVHTIAGIPSQDPQDAHWLSTVLPERHKLAQACRADWNELLKRRSASYEEDRNVSANDLLKQMKELFPHFEVFIKDYEIFANDFALSIRNAMVNGPEADADDYAANIHLWGFEIDDITIPVTIWHGDLDDDVEFIYGEYTNRRIPGSKLVRLEGLGHIDIMVEARAQILSAAIGSLTS